MDIEFRTKLKKENNFLDLEIGDVFEYNHNIYMKIFDNVIGQNVCLCLFDNYKNLSAFTSDMICVKTGTTLPSARRNPATSPEKICHLSATPATSE